MGEEYIDWVPGLDLIPNKKDKVILELGLGVGTRFLAEKFKHVYSFEVFHSKEWYDRCVSSYKEFTNWSHKFISFNEIGLDESETKLLESKGQYRDMIVFQKYLEELNDFVDLTKIDVAFVDQGFHLRGESVNYFLDKGIPVVMCHDYKTGHELYGWGLIKDNLNYRTDMWNSPQGLNIWFKK